MNIHDNSIYNNSCVWGVKSQVLDRISKDLTAKSLIHPNNVKLLERHNISVPIPEINISPENPQNGRHLHVLKSRTSRKILHSNDYKKTEKKFQTVQKEEYKSKVKTAQ